MDSIELLDLSERLTNACTNSEIYWICHEIARELRFDYFLFGLCEPVFSLNDPNIQIITDYPEEWMALYKSKDLLLSDPVVSYMQNRTAPIIWSKLITLAGYDNVEYLSFMEQAGSHGLKNGLSIPLKGPSGELGVFSLAHSKSGSTSDDLCREAMTSAQYFAVCILDAMLMRTKPKKNSTKDSLSQKLTNREYECLFWACEGKSAWEISSILKISERTVLFHLTNVTTKLGAANRQHAVAKALMQGIVKPRIAGNL